MKRLLLLRHAKSSWGDPALDDFERPLAPRGRRAAPLMASALLERGWAPDAALVSPAARTRETWALVAAALPDAPEPAFPKPLYLASPAVLLDTVRRAPAAAEVLLLLGHNPGLERLAAQLAGPDSDPAALAALRSKFPTAGLAVVEAAGEWSALEEGGGRLVAFLTPKGLE